MSSLNGHHAAGGPSPGGQSSFPQAGAYSNISSLSSLRLPSQHMGSTHSKPTSSLPFKGIVAGGIKIKRAFAAKKKKSEDILTNSAGHDSPSSLSPTHVLNITSENSVLQQQPSSPPPPPPSKHDSHLPSPLNTERSKAVKRTSVLPISPGISPAVNYMLQQQQTDTSQSPPSQPQQQPQPLPSQQQSVPAHKDEKEKVKLGGGTTDNNMLDKKESKESWRKSDSTNSHRTVRPGGGSTRTSRPVSWAESFQSAHTVVQVSNKRLSALVTDADFGMPEEDVESVVPLGASHLSKSTPPSSLKTRNRRSMSLNLGTPIIAQTSTPPSTSSATDPRQMLLSAQPTTSPDQFSSPIRNLISIHPPVSPAPLVTVAGQLSQPSTANIRGRFAAWTIANSSTDSVSRQERTLPASPSHQRRPSYSQRTDDYLAASGGGASASATTSLRQTAISMTASGLGPAAAGLAKRAVEKMGRKWGMGLSPSTSGSGSGCSSSSSSMNAPSSFSSASHTDYGLVRTSSNQSAPSVHSYIVKSSRSLSVGLAGGGGKRRTPDAPSGAYSIRSESDMDPLTSPSGPILGTLLRGGQQSKNGAPIAGGVVFGKELSMVARETAVNVGKGMRSAGMDGGKVKEGLVLELEGRLVPAIVVRCAQHLLIWGVQEEGLFRVNGHPSHVSKLRSEFDSGVDYDMMECSPGDLDPHAVASVFKAYLRELPESILTRVLSPFFDAAIKKEASTNFPEQNRLLGVGRGNNTNPGLLQGPKSGFTVRKPPSLTTLAMPTFIDIPPPSTSLVADIRSLISQLPQENYDLLRTVVDLIKATGKESKKTKMPLSNLLLVFCPSLNMTPPLLKVFCEAEDIWAGESGADSPPPPLPTKDGQFEIAKREEAEMADTPETDDDDEVEEKSLMSSGQASLDTTDDPNSGYHASEEEDASLFEESQVVTRRWVSERNKKRSEIPTVYLDSMSHHSSSSASSLREPLEPSGHQHHRHLNSRDGMIIAEDDGSISSESQLVHPDPLCSSSTESVATPTSEANSSFSQLPVCENRGGEKRIHGAGPVKIVDPDSIPMLSPAPTTTPKKKPISQPINVDVVQFPQLLSTPLTRQAKKRISIPLLSLPNLSPASLTSSSDDRDNDSPCPSPTSASSGVVNVLTKRSKRPSLRLLFSKKSRSSLNSTGERSGESGTGIPYISNPIPQHRPQGSYSSTGESGTSDSSGSTPLSAVTASSGMSSRSHLPPVLDTPIEDPSLSLDLRFDGSPPETAVPLKGTEGMREQQKLASVGKGVASPISAESTDFGDAPSHTPIAGRVSTISDSPSPSPGLLTDVPSLSLSVPQRPYLTLETSASSKSSTPSPRLSLPDDDGEDEEDWTQCVLSAADKLS